MPSPRDKLLSEVHHQIDGTRQWLAEVKPIYAALQERAGKEPASSEELALIDSLAEKIAFAEWILGPDELTPAQERFAGLRPL